VLPPQQASDEYQCANGEDHQREAFAERGQALLQR
jgi:hypothetical protein